MQVGDFVEAQRLKMEIMKRETELNHKYQKLRESNIRTMMHELESKQRNELLSIEARRDEKLMENERQKGKRWKELNDKQDR